MTKLLKGLLRRLEGEYPNDYGWLALGLLLDPFGHSERMCRRRATRKEQR